jgi:hypothetical protein
MPCFDNESASVRRQKTAIKNQAEVKHPNEGHGQSVDALETDDQPSLLIGRLGSSQLSLRRQQTLTAVPRGVASHLVNR